MTPILLLAPLFLFQDPPPEKKPQAPVPVFETKVLLERVEELAREVLEKDGVPGLSIAIDKDGELLLSKGWGWADAKGGTSVMPDTRFPIGTLTRQFTAVAVLQLVDAKKLALEDEVSKVLPGCSLGGRKVTVQQLLSNTAGTPDRAALEKMLKSNAPDKSVADLDERTFLSLFDKAPFAFEPGVGFALDNTGWILLSLIVQKVSGEPYVDYVRKNVIEIAGLEQTTFCPIDLKPVVGFSSTCKNATDAVDLDLPSAKPRTFLSQTLCASATDLVKWQRALVDRAVFSERASRLIMTPTALPDGNSTNYGYAIEMSRLGEYKLYAHTGGGAGFQVRLAYYSLPHVTVCVLANCDSAPVERIEREIALIVLQIPAPETLDLTLDAAEIKRNAGVYQIATTRITIREKDGALWYEPAQQEPTRLRYQGEHIFVWDSDRTARVTFHGQGEIAESFELFRGGFTSVAKRFE